MPSFDVLSEINWPEVENARNQALKETSQRFDFKHAKATIDIDAKEKQITLTIDRDDKIEALVDVFRDKLAKRGLSLLSFTFEKVEASLGGGARRRAQVQSGIDKDNAKKIIKTIKDASPKTQVQIQNEQLRVSAKKRDELQAIIALLNGLQTEFKLPLQFGNFRE